MTSLSLLYGGRRARGWRAVQIVLSSSLTHGFCRMRSSSSETESEQLFNYTSGRWLYNESLRLSERRLSFNVDALRQAAAQCLGILECDVQSVFKLAEGGFNRVFELVMADGENVLARLPYPSTQPHRLAVASEAATLNLLRSHGIPVPKVLDYSTDPENLVGAEYMILEKLPGRSLADRWFDLSETQRLKVTAQIVQIEARLSQIVLPAYGSVYYVHDLPDEIERITISSSEHAEGFCLGPSTTLGLWHKERERLHCRRGPFRTAVDLLQSLAEKELTWLEAFGRPRFPLEPAYMESVESEKVSPKEHSDSLKKYIEIAQYLIPHEAELHKPVLRHPDLHPDNIFCTDDLEVVGLIDWQHSSVLPQFLAAGIPNYFANYHDEESLRFVPPKLPENFSDLDHEEQLEASEIYRRRHLHFFYLGFTQRFNPSHFQALSRQTDLLTRKAFVHASQPWEGNNIPLRSDLIHITKVWPKFLAENQHEAKGVPIHFTQTDIDQTLNRLRQQEDIDTEMEKLRNLIGVSIDGWTSVSEFEDAVNRAELVKEHAFGNLDTDEEREMTLWRWPFDDFDEDE